MFQRANSRLRTVVAIATAYAFALQLLLTGILATQMAVASAASANPFAICYSGTPAGGDHNGAGTPTAHQTCCNVCAVAWIAPPSPPASQPSVIRFVSAVAFRAAAAPPALAGQTHSPRTSQGPPQVA
jgi:hypothetical protein